MFPSGYHAAELARVKPGKTVAIFGAGPIGLLAAHSAVLKGASDLYVLDSLPERLAIAKEFGATPVDLTEGDPVEQISHSVGKIGGRFYVPATKSGEESTA